MYEGSAAEIENMSATDLDIVDQGGTLYIMETDNAYVLPKEGDYRRTAFLLKGMEFTMYAEHYTDGTHDDNEADYYCSMVSTTGGAVVATWLNQKPKYNKWQSRGAGHYVSLCLPADWLRRENVLGSAWAARNDVVFDIKLTQIENAIPGDYGVYAVAQVGGTINVTRTWGESCGMHLKNMLLAGPKFVLGGIFGDSGVHFVDTMAKIMTADLPGIPGAIRLMVALPINFVVIYVGIIFVRGFIPFLGGGGT